MKNFIYISLLSLGLFATSCTKEEVVINNADFGAVPTWDNPSSEKKAESEVLGAGGDSVVIGETGAGEAGSTPGDGDITDPNNDPDGKKKKL